MERHEFPDWKVHPMKIKMHLGLFFATSRNFRTLEIELTETVETRQQWINVIEILIKLLSTKNSISSQNVNQAWVQNKDIFRNAMSLKRKIRFHTLFPRKQLEIVFFQNKTSWDGDEKELLLRTEGKGFAGSQWREMH